MKKIALLLYTVIVLVLAASCDRRAEYLTASGAMLGTTFQATGDITDCTAQELYRAIMQIDAEAKASMSIFDSTSLLSRINRGETDSLDEHIIYNLRLAERFSRLSEGHYDVTVKPLVDTWGFAGHEAERTPNLDSLLQFVGYRRVHIRDGRLVKDDPRVQLDFNSIAKGYTVDLVAALMERCGVRAGKKRLLARCPVHLSAAGWWSAADRVRGWQKVHGAATWSARQRVYSDKAFALHGTFRNQS